MKLPALAAGVIVILGLGTYVVGGPFLTLYSIKQAIADRDSEALQDHVNFPALRDNLKEQVNAFVVQQVPVGEKSGLAALAAVFVGKIAEAAVDAMVTPVGLARIGSGDYRPVPSGTSTEDVREAKVDELFKGAHFRFDNLRRASFLIPGKDATEVRLVLTRSGLNWRLTNIVLPLPNDLAKAAPSVVAKPVRLTAHDQACATIESFAESHIAIEKAGAVAGEGCPQLVVEQNTDGLWEGNGILNVKQGMFANDVYFFRAIARPAETGDDWRVCRFGYHNVSEGVKPPLKQISEC